MQILRRSNLSTGAGAARISSSQRAGLQLSATLSAYRQELVRPAFAKVLPISGFPLGRFKVCFGICSLDFQALSSCGKRWADIHFLTSSALCRSARAGQNRKPCCENQPFLSQFLKCGLAGHWFGSNHDQKSRGKQRPMQATDFTQPSSDSIACHCLAQAPRGYQTKTCPASYRISRNAQPQQTALRRASLRPHQGKFTTQPDADSPRKSKPLRLRCAGRMGSRHPWAAGVCDRVGAGGSKSRGHPSFSFERENRTGAYACACLAGRCVS